MTCENIYLPLWIKVLSALAQDVMFAKLHTYAKTERANVSLIIKSFQRHNILFVEKKGRNNIITLTLYGEELARNCLRIEALVCNVYTDDVKSRKSKNKCDGPNFKGSLEELKNGN